MLVVGFSGCDHSSRSPITSEQASLAPHARLETIKFKQESGAEAFTMKLLEDGAKLIDPSEKELARYKQDETRKIKIKNAEDKVLGYIVPEADYWKIKDAQQTQELYVLRHQDGQDYKLENGENQLIYHIRVRNYGYEIEAPGKQSLYKVKLRDGKISLRDASDRTILATRAKVLPIVVACFGMDALSREQQAGLAYAIELAGGH